MLNPNDVDMKEIPTDMTRGSVFESNNFGTFVVEKYTSSKDVIIRFIRTNYRKKTSSSSIRNGTVKDPYHPSVYGIGFIGCGNCSPRNNGKASKACTTWNGMLERCYANSKTRDFSYRDCVVCNEWHNFQNFAEWFDDNYVDGYHIDKDIVGNKTKVYSPETCSFVPPLTNILEANTMKWGSNST